MAKLVRSGAAAANTPKVQEQTQGQGKAWKSWTAADVLARLTVPEGGEQAVEAYVKKHLKSLKKQAEAQIPEAPQDALLSMVEAAINDGHIEFGKEGDGHEVIGASQDMLKTALKSLLTRRSAVIAHLYEKHAEYNRKYFNNDLSVPVITIDRLSNRTLGNYTEGEDANALEHHIRFNTNFIALQLEDDNMVRILETLRHEMIHQWQDEVLYGAKGDLAPTKQITMLRKDEEGNISYVEAVQKKRPKEWHNKDFKDMAECVGIPAIGAKCYGNPCRMPEAKSYNRKFVCGCVASNGYPQTVWSTRPIIATCKVCKNDFVEVGKEMTKGTVIAVTMSHIEKKGQDAVHDAKKEQFEHFEKFPTRDEKELFVAAITGEMEQGVYQKNHNAYQDGFRYWVAFNGAHPSKGRKSKAPTEADKPTKRRKPQDVAASEVEAGMKQTAPTVDVLPKEPEAARTYSADDPQDIIDLYRTEEGCTQRKLAAILGIGQSTLNGRIKKYQIDFNAGTFVVPE